MTDLEQLRAETARLQQVLLAIANCPKHSRLDWYEMVEWMCSHASAALSADPEPAVDGPDWEGFGRALMENWPTGDVEGSELFDLSHKYRLIVEAPGGYDPEEGE